jgi:hypothetical protein
MRKIYVILGNPNDKYKINLVFYFKKYDLKFINLTELNKIDKEDLLFINKNYHPFKNKIDNLDNITDKFYYLSKDKQIYFVSKNNYSFDNNILNIKDENNINIIFDTTTEYNNLTHEEKKEIKDYTFEDYQIFSKLIAYGKLNNIFNKSVAIKIINDYIEYKYNKKRFLNQIVIINDHNINNVYQELLIKNKSAKQIFQELNEPYVYTFIIMIKNQSHENLNIINMIKSKFNEMDILCYFYYISKIKNINIILQNRLLYFENIIVSNNLLPDIKYKKYIESLNNCNSIISKNLVITRCAIFLQYQLSDTNDTIIDNMNLLEHLKYFIANHDFANIDSTVNIQKYKSSYKIKPNLFLLEKILFNIKDYNGLLSCIDKHLKENYDMKINSNLIIKKITAAVLTQKEHILNEQLVSIFNYVDNIDVLMCLDTLIERTKFDKIKTKMYIKILSYLIDKINEKEKDKLTLGIKYFVKLLKMQIEPICMKELLKKINLNKYFLSIFKHNEILCFIIKNIAYNTSDQELLKEVNDFIKENYQIDKINDIDTLINLTGKLEINKNVVILFLLQLTSTFDSYYDSYDKFLLAREQIKKNLEYIENKIDSINGKIDLNQINLFTNNNFDLSYQGVPSPDIFRLRNNILRKICPDLNYKIDTNFTNKKIKVLFHASQLNRIHSVYKDRHQVIKNLSEDPRFDVYFSTFDELIPEVKFTFGKAKHILLTRNLYETRDRLAKMNLDIIVYCEIGMDASSAYMSYMKLAKIQCNTWGHSDTSGISTIDYYFSSKLYELEYEESQKHYTEKLILQNSLCTSYVNPCSRHNIGLFKDRYHFGFTDENVIYFCAQSLFKFNPIFDDYIINILNNVPNSVLIMLNSSHKNKFISRFKNKNVSSRIHFFPLMNHFEFMNLMNISDICLDVYPFGGCNSSMEAFSLGKVIISQPSIMINGRFTYGFYKKMGLEKYICNNKEEYIKFAIKVGNDPEYRKNIEREIKEKNNMLFMDKETIEEWKTDLIKIYNDFSNK